MPPPPNTTPATAIDLGARPVDLLVDVTVPPAGGALWYRLTVAPGEVVVGLSAVAAPGGAYALLSIYSDAGDTPYLSLATFNRLQMPVTVGATYYLGITSIPGGSTSVRLTLDVAPNLATPIGAIAINDDTPGFPLAVLSASSGSVLQFRPAFPAGETGAALPNGRSLWEDGFAPNPQNAYQLFDATLTRVASPVWDSLHTAPGDSAIATRGARFYVGDTGGGSAPARVTTISDAGVFGPTIWTLPAAGLQAIGVSPDETVLYHTGLATGLGQILRWDLLTHVALAPLAAVVSGYAPGDLLVLADGTVVVAYARFSPKDSFIRHYAANGATLHTYPLGAVELNHLALALDDPLSVWAWSFLSGASSGLSRFQRLRVSDGAVLTTFEVPQYEGGGYQGATQPPVAPFGHSFSCPFVVLPMALAPVDADAPPVPEPLPPCVTAPPVAACWAPHDLTVLQIGLIAEDTPP
ncbi:MAG TPA: hypothetical protein VJ829_05060 [Candidatus Binatia bacterium]|nr:hypothetical protein [Candidatus Binatia bacterium]